MFILKILLFFQLFLFFPTKKRVVATMSPLPHTYNCVLL
nr:MAG TPA: hypothetical protein [Caudoviricetes sp.]